MKLAELPGQVLWERGRIAPESAHSIDSLLAVGRQFEPPVLRRCSLAAL